MTKQESDRSLRSVDDPAVSPAIPAAIEDNAGTGLDFTDLVFVDPVGTGFARPARTEYGAEFLQHARR